MEGQYTIKTEVFEGPLGLLLTLIEKRKLLINDISLAAVTDDFIKHMNTGEGMPLSQRTHFVLTAATLLLIKSKSLLPMLELTESEAGDVEDLENRLKLYTIFRRQGSILQMQFGNAIMYAPNLNIQSKSVFSPHKGIKIHSMKVAMHRVLRALPQKELVPKAVVDKIVSLEETIVTLTERLAKNLSLSFKEFAGTSKEEKVQVIVSFLAMLELVKQGMLSVKQDKLFADIQMETANLTTPRYT